jgi:hypothetical protein
MTVLADAAAIYAGDVAAVAVYAGTRRIWPPWTGTAASGVINEVHVVTITFAATWVALQVPATPILLTLDQGSRDWTATHPTGSAQWRSSDGQRMFVFSQGSSLDQPDLADLVANEGAPVELRWRSGSEWELVFNP